MATINSSGFEDPSRLTKWVKYSCYFGIAGCVCMIFSDYLDYKHLYALSAGSELAAEAGEF